MAPKPDYDGLTVGDVWSWNDDQPVDYELVEPSLVQAS